MPHRHSSDWNDAVVYTNLGTALGHKGDRDGAIEEFASPSG
jgi:hypothetical protein